MEEGDEVKGGGENNVTVAGIITDLPSKLWPLLLISIRVLKLHV